MIDKQQLIGVILCAFLTGANCGAFALRVYLRAWDAFNVAVLVLGLLWFAWVLWRALQPT